MSRDQKPGKVRVIGQRDGGAPPHPLRRATDFDPNAIAGSMDDRGTGLAGGAAAADAKSGLSLVPIFLFLIACAAGAVGFTMFILPGLAR
ncbi:hypothetical protein [Sphingosinicella sp. BN140058]|uniref:hypothetical protein n=1 Tax=Sphingosinicella sp. BN140058 TaxID=1892855 RepID=UPI001013A0AB|nr:hypothetical protein [Sphingosinicella sp. BN140058]QAY77292.1 hypothetical protein ETR14_12830 [Sphingosinicella sp. BN140058]